MAQCGLEIRHRAIPVSSLFFGAQELKSSVLNFKGSLSNVQLADLPPSCKQAQFLIIGP